MTTVTMELPEKVLVALRFNPKEFTRDEACCGHHMGKVSQEVAARNAGMNRTDFLLALARAGKDSFQVDCLILPIISCESSRKVCFNVVCPEGMRCLAEAFFEGE